MANPIKKSPWIFHFDTGGCNGCSIELVDALTPRHDVERFGILLKGSPKHADIFIVTGCAVRKTEERILNLYSQIPEPKIVMAVGACGCSGGVFKGCYCVKKRVDQIIPVDYYVPGCPPRPEALLNAIKKAIDDL